ncbi:hypothetical protein [Nitrosomonas sp. Nm33]|uniref:beta strand repeat-containing protein n=1 Tax=Nitrosomonas sp. Nm33 TaxID=133724 RepID=UPI000898D895|nr:hypothetical protein [Nitrosomonas sp. Nm33]SDY50352.1 hypothetical protein SAMN05421755_102627 [Nitrosomonas sp. Nm33]
MAITPQQKENILALTVATFNAAPGSVFLQDFAKAVEAGMSFENLADELVATRQFKQDILHGAVTNQEIAAALLTNFGLTAGNTDPASPDAQAEAFFIARLVQGVDLGDILLEASNFLLGTVPQEFQPTADLFQNKILVADLYSVKNDGLSVAALQAVLADVTAAGPSTEAEATQFLTDHGFTPPTGQPGGVHTLTINQDNILGGAGDDTFEAGVVLNGATPTNTLQSFDTLDGNGGNNDILNATLAQNIVVAPTLKNIENISLRFAGTDDLNLSNATGVNTVTLHDSTFIGTVSGLGSIANLAVKNQNQDVKFDGSTAATLALGLNAFGKSGTPNNVDLGSVTAAKATTLNVTANNANAKIDSTAADAIQTLSIAASGTNTLSLVDSGATITTATITGAGSVDLTGTAFTGGMTTFDASKNTGGVKAVIAGTKAVAVSGGDGADTFDLDTGNAAGSSVALGKGDDKLFVGKLLGQFDKGVNGGDGTDIINITDGATLTATTAAFITNFETLDVSGGAGKYDVSLNNFATVQIDEAINGTNTAPIDFINAPDAFTLNVASKANDGDFALTTGLGGAVTVTGKDFTGTTAKGDTETFTFVATINDGNKDDVANGNINADTVTAHGVENLVIDAHVGTLDGGSKALGASAHTLTANLVDAQAETLTIKGDASVNLSGVTFIGVVSKVDATASKGNVTIDFSAHAKNVAYNGAEGVDTYKSSTVGDVIYTGKSGDAVTLTAVGARDTFVLKAATDSQITDTSKDGKITIGADTGFDNVTGFVTGGTTVSDRLDVTNLGFSGAQRGVVDVTSQVTAATDLTSIADLFNSPAGDRGVAFSTVGTDTFALIDANKDGNFTAADDLIVKLTGVASLSETDINF